MTRFGRVGDRRWEVDIVTDSRDERVIRDGRRHPATNTNGGDWISCIKWDSQQMGAMRAPNRHRARVSGQHARFPTPDAAIGGIIHAGGTDGVFDSDVAKAYR